MKWTQGEPVVVVPVASWRGREHGVVEHVHRDGSCRALGRRWRPCGREHAGLGGVRLVSAAEVARRDDLLRALAVKLAANHERRALLDRIAEAEPPVEVLRAFVEQIETTKGGQSE